MSDLEPLAVALKFGFLAVLYLFLLWVTRMALRDLRSTASPGLEFLPNLVKGQEWDPTCQHLLAQFPQALGEGRARGEGWSVLV